MCIVNPSEAGGQLSKAKIRGRSGLRLSNALVLCRRETECTLLDGRAHASSTTFLSIGLKEM